MGDIRIGLDGRALCNISRYRGVGRYTACLVQSLVKMGVDYQFVLFGRRDGFDPDLIEPRIMEHLEWREIPSAKRLPFADVTVDHLLYARAVNRAGLSLFHGIDHNLTPFIKCPSIVTVHDLILLILRGSYLGPRSWMWMKAHYHASLKASLIVAISETTRRDAERIWGIPGERIEVVYEGVGKHYRPVSDEGVIDKTLEKYGIRRPYFLYVGGFDPRKNVYNMLLAFKLFHRNSRDYHLALCGDTLGYEGYLRDVQEELGLADCLIITGHVPHWDLPPIYSEAASLILLSTYEGFGLPVLESMACGTPVLLSREASLPEIAGEAGLYVDHLEPREIASAITRLAHDAELRKDLGEKGIRRASDFTWEKATNKMLELYSRVLG